MKKQAIYTAGFCFLSLLFILSAVLLGKLGTITLSLNAVKSEPADGGTEPVIVIDPGHGGEDGGCSAADGTTEKMLNLDVSLRVAAMLRASGHSVAVTRTDDKMLYDLYDDRENYKGYKKIYDLKNRLRFTEDSGAGLFVGIHMNKFPIAKYSGLQVYYSKNNDGGESLAEMLRAYTVKYLQPDNERQTKPAGSNIYLLNRLEIPAVLVECGFLSNPEEAEKLGDSKYRGELALTLAAAVSEYAAGAFNE